MAEPLHVPALPPPSSVPIVRPVSAVRMQGESALLVLNDALPHFFPGVNFTPTEIQSLRKRWNVAARSWAKTQGVLDGHGQKIAHGSLWQLGLPRAVAKGHLRHSVPNIKRRQSDTVVRQNQLEQQRIQLEQQRLLNEAQQAQQQVDQAQQLVDNFSDDADESRESEEN